MIIVSKLLCVEYTDDKYCCFYYSISNLKYNGEEQGSNIYHLNCKNWDFNLEKYISVTDNLDYLEEQAKDLVLAHLYLKESTGDMSNQFNLLKVSF